MKILFGAPLHIGIYGRTGGVLREIRAREAALTGLGHSVTYFDPWTFPDFSSFDVCHLFVASGDSLNFARIVVSHIPLVVSPIVDRHESAVKLRAKLLYSRVLPGVDTHLGSCQTICSLADGMCFRSRDEEMKCRDVLKIRTPGAIALCPVLLPPFRNRVSAEIEQSVAEPFVLFVGDYGNPRKNILTLISALKNTDIRLMIAGRASPGALSREIKRIVGRTKAMSLLGEINEDEKHFLVKRARAFVLPSFMEGIGLAALEAAMLGATVVVTKNGGTSDYFGDGAYYIDPASWISVRNGILHAVENPKDCAETLSRRIDINKVGRDLVDIYRSATARERPTHGS